MFSWFANLIDSAPDSMLSEQAGKDYSGSVNKIGLVVLLFLITLVVIGVAWWSGTHIEETQYMQLRETAPAASADNPQQPASTGATVTEPLYTFPLPSYSPRRLQAWTSRALSETLTFNFTDVDQRIAEAGEYYTPGARDSMLQAIASEEIAETVRSRRLSVALTPISPPFVIKSYIVESGGDRSLYWDVEAPVILNYVGAASSEAINMRIYLRIKQVPTTESPDGLAIAGFYARVTS